MTDRPLVSVVVPSFNQGKYLERTLVSILNQDYSNIEIFVADGGSTDETLSILERYSDRIKFCSELDGGQSSAINKGFRKTSGKIVSWLNSDDIYIYKDTISKIVDTFDESKDIDLLFGDYIRIDENDVLLKPYLVWRQYDFNRLLRICYISQPTVFMRRDVLDKIAVDETLHYGMDLDLWLQVGAQGLQMAHSGRFVAGERIHALAKTVKDIDKSRAEGRALRKRYITDDEVLQFGKLTVRDSAGMMLLRLAALPRYLALRRARGTAIPIKSGDLLRGIATQFRRA